MLLKKKALIVAVLLAVAVTAVVTVYADYDSSTDPLISKSYLDSVFKAEVTSSVQAQIDAATKQQQETIDALRSQLDEMKKKADELSKQISDNHSEAIFSVVFLKEGQKLICNTSNDISTEIVLRSGAAKVVSEYDSTGGLAQGLSDLTDGKELYGGEQIPMNHHIVVPRGDGRGLVVTHNEGAYFLVKGPFSIIDA